jgi:small subunit ribosomal protein S9
MATKETTKYIATTGRRKEAIARVRLTPSTRTLVTVNNKEINAYFSTPALQLAALEPFIKTALATQFTVTATIRGGGIAGQAIAFRHALSRALSEYDTSLRSVLKKEGFLKRDPRAKERRKAGFVKARKRKQWSKR